MSVFLWVCLALGLFAGILESWNKNQEKIKSNDENNLDSIERKGFNSKTTGIILIIIVAVLGILVLKGVSNLGSESIISGNKKYEEIAIEYIENISRDNLSYMTLVDTSSYSLDKEVRVTLKYRFTEGPNISYINYTIAVDKDTNTVVGIEQY